MCGRAAHRHPAGHRLRNRGATLELLEIGVKRAVAVDASEAYVAAARNEANRCGRAEAVDCRHGDFVTLASHFQPATVVTLDRVICCYPAYPARKCEVAVETILIYPQSLREKPSSSDSYLKTGITSHIIDLTRPGDDRLAGNYSQVSLSHRGRATK